MSDTFNHEADAWDSLNDEYDREDDDGPPSWSPKPPQCKYCGSKNVLWVHLETGWRLFTAEKPHTCAEYILTIQLQQSTNGGQ